MARILVVDDEEQICEEFKEILEEESHTVDVAHRGQEALDKIVEKDYDLVFLDVLMPKMEGREVFEKMRRISPVPVVIMSGYLPQNKEQEVLNMGAFACISKPLDLKHVKALLKMALK